MRESRCSSQELLFGIHGASAKQGPWGQSAERAGCELKSVLRQQRLRGLSVRAQARRMGICLSFSVVEVVSASRIRPKARPYLPPKLKARGLWAWAPKRGNFTAAAALLPRPSKPEATANAAELQRGFGTHASSLGHLGASKLTLRTRTRIDTTSYDTEASAAG